jgi:hypothetical protein
MVPTASGFDVSATETVRESIPHAASSSPIVAPEASR